MDCKTIERLKNLPANVRCFSIEYKENFYDSGGAKVEIELHIPAANLYWTDKIPANIFEEVRNEALNTSFEEAKEELKALTDKYFSVTFEKNYLSNGDEKTNCVVYEETVGHFISINFKDAIKQLKDALEEQKGGNYERENKI